MTCQEARAVLEQLQEQCQAICDIAKIAKRNIKSLSGASPYGKRFHDASVALSKAETKLGFQAPKNGNGRQDRSKPSFGGKSAWTSNQTMVRSRTTLAVSPRPSTGTDTSSIISYFGSWVPRSAVGQASERRCVRIGTR
jgi:hypothetical protein